MAYKDGMHPTNIDTHTYIFPTDVLKQPRHVEGYPTSLTQEGMGYLVELDYEMDPEIVNHPAYRDELVSSLKSIPTLSIVLDPADLFGQRFSSDGERLDPRISGIYFGHLGPRSEARASIESSGVRVSPLNDKGVSGRSRCCEEFLMPYRLSVWAFVRNSPHHQFSFTLGQSSDGCFECVSKYTKGGNRRHLPRATDERTKKTHRSQAGRGMGGRSIP